MAYRRVMRFLSMACIANANYREVFWTGTQDGIEPCIVMSSLRTAQDRSDSVGPGTFAEQKIGAGFSPPPWREKLLDVSNRLYLSIGN